MTYTYEERKCAVDLLIRYDLRVAPTIRELGYPSRQMLYNWYKEFKSTGELRDANGGRRSKYTNEQRREALKYYCEHGRSVSQTIKALGFPRLSTLKDWVRDEFADEITHCVSYKNLIRYPEETKEQAVIRLCAGESSVSEIASELGASGNSVRLWKKRLLGEGRITPMRKKKVELPHSKGSEVSPNIEVLRAERDALAQEKERLEREVYRLQMEKDVLEIAGELLKKGKGVSLQELSNQEKTVLIDALRNRYQLQELLLLLDIAKSSYCYQRVAQHKPDPLAILRDAVKKSFSQSEETYGYRRVHSDIRKAGNRVSEKVIRRLMAEEGLRVKTIKKRKYNSYAGEISPEVENLINRDFSALSPNEKWLTDITEFSIPAGKAYLSPVIDCFDGMAVSWSISTSPNAELANSMLDAAVAQLGDGEHPIIHSDRGCHYRWPGWIERTEKAGLVRSMSKKGCSPDNAACEGFFGRLKNEMFYGRSWWNVTMDAFIKKLDSYLCWYNETRIKMSLGGMSPLEYRRSLGLIPLLHNT